MDGGDVLLFTSHDKIEEKLAKFSKNWGEGAGVYRPPVPYVLATLLFGA